MPDWEQIQTDWETNDISFPEIAAKYGVKLSTVKSRKQRMGWSKDGDAIGAASATTRMQPDATASEEVEENGLTRKEQDFVYSYIKSFNITQSAIKAGYSPRSAHVIGHRLLKKDKVAKEIKKIKDEMNHELFLEAKDIVMMYVKIAMADITDFVKFGNREVELKDEYTGEPDLYTNGQVKKYNRNQVDFVDSEMVDGTIITEVKQGKDGVSVKLADKHKAMEFLVKHFDMVPDPFKRQLELERLKLERARLYGVEQTEEMEDDGFMEALDAKTAEVWGDSDGA